MKYLFALMLCVNLFLINSAYGINPKRHYDATPDAIGINFKVIKIPVNDSITLNSWACLQAEKDKPFIVISGTDGGNMSNSLGQAKAFYEAGYNVVMYDYRGFGESSDFNMNPDMVYYDEFSEDLKKTLQYVKTTFEPSSIILYGMSMGTIVSRMNVDYDKSIKGLILDSFVINPSLIVERILNLKDRQLLLPDGSFEYSISNEITLEKPVLIFSGLQDVVTQSSDYEGFLSANKNSKIVTWDCNHLECFTSMGEDSSLYVSHVKMFIESLLL